MFFYTVYFYGRYGLALKRVNDLIGTAQDNKNKDIFAREKLYEVSPCISCFSGEAMVMASRFYFFNLYEFDVVIYIIGDNFTCYYYYYYYYY